MEAIPEQLENSFQAASEQTKNVCATERIPELAKKDIAEALNQIENAPILIDNEIKRKTGNTWWACYRSPIAAAGGYLGLAANNMDSGEAKTRCEAAVEELKKLREKAKKFEDIYANWAPDEIIEVYLTPKTGQHAKMEKSLKNCPKLWGTSNANIHRLLRRGLPLSC